MGYRIEARLDASTVTLLMPFAARPQRRRSSTAS
jgi:hypothetical protein